jgi:serine/threonine protein kinase
VFVTKQGLVKVFDFGVAHAVAEFGHKEGHHEKSKFDPHTLGALTPAYASVELLKGGQPVEQDDIYALACITYELFTGEHPFKRFNADVAQYKKLKPKRIKSLSLQQWFALKKALSFNRVDRTTTVYEFSWDMTQTKKSLWPKRIVIIALLLAGVLICAKYYFEYGLLAY